MTIAHLLELLPIVLALVAAVMCATACKTARKSLRPALLLGVVCSCLLVIAQTSWWGSYILQGDLQGTTWANHIWTLFNSLAMCAFIALSRADRA